MSAIPALSPPLSPTIHLPTRVWKTRHSAHLFVKTADITQHAAASTPAPRTHSMQGESGNTITRAWCDECGCGLWIKPSTKPDMTCLKGGMLLSFLLLSGCVFFGKEVRC